MVYTCECTGIPGMTLALASPIQMITNCDRVVSMRLGRWILLAGIGWMSVSGWAETGSSTIKDIIPIIQTWATHPELVAAVKSQNAQARSLASIQALDNAWVKAANEDPLVQGVLHNSAASTLKTLAGSKPYYVELILMDQYGANVAATQRTSDYWQGDEAKFLETYPKGPDAIHKGKPEYDASVKGYVVQVSIPIVDQGQNIGALTVNILLKAIP